MAGIESEESTEVSAQIFGAPFPHRAESAIEIYSLTPLAEKRIADNMLPPHLSTAARAVLHHLSQNGPAEEDELADWLNMNSVATGKIMESLMGYGFVTKSTGPTATV